jgi:outer membrane protein OmpA-like peptidoglycan-associated protein
VSGLLGRAIALVGVVGCVVAGSACAGSTLRGRVSGLEQHIADAEQRGAMRCAPRELALAKAHLHFAAVDLDQGELSNAQAHVEIAEPNANAAFDLSPPERCTAREFEEINAPKPGDRDGDGLADNIDKCPDEPETYNGFQDEDGCPDEADTDSDGIGDNHDQCILEPEDKDGYLDEDGCPDPDNDGVGVADTFDFCPNTPGVNGGDKPGCPRKNSGVVVTKTQILITQQIQFQFNRAIIRPISFKILDEVVDALKDHPEINLEIQGHTDNVGSAGYNKILSQQRANSVMKYFIMKGILHTRLTAKGYGMEQPMVPNTTPENRELNRRVQFNRTDAASATP